MEPLKADATAQKKEGKEEEEGVRENGISTAEEKGEEEEEKAGDPDANSTEEKKKEEEEKEEEEEEEERCVFPPEKEAEGMARVLHKLICDGEKKRKLTLVPNRQRWHAKIEAPLERVHFGHTFLHVWHRFRMLSRCLATKFLLRSSVGSLLRVCCWLGSIACTGSTA